MTQSNNLTITQRNGWSVAEWADLYGFSRAFAYQLVKDGKVKKSTVGRRSIITKEADDAFRSTLNNVEA